MKKGDTKEEVLTQHCKNERGAWVGLILNNVLEAMEDYAIRYHRNKIAEAALHTVPDKEITPTIPFK